MKKLFSILIVAALAIVSSAADKKLNIVATLPDLGAIAHEVGGEMINLSILAGPSEDPHFVDPRPSFAKLLNKADLLIDGGVELEIGWLPPLVQNARNARILAGQQGRLDASLGIDLKERPTGPVDRSQGDVHPMGNPHYLMDPLNGIIVARAFAQRFAALDPSHAAQFQQNAEKFAGAIQKEMPALEKAMAPFKGEKVITYHRTFPYFMDRFGLQLFDTIEPKPGIEPSPSHITGLITKSKGAGIKMILIEENRPRRTPERVAQEIGAKVIIIHHMPEAKGEDRYLAWIRGMVDAIVKSK